MDTPILPDVAHQCFRALLAKETTISEAARAELQRWLDIAAAPITGSTSDGYHTFDELYDHRITLFIALCEEVDARTPTGHVWRSKLHSDGSSIDGWFIMGIGTQPGKQITYHLPLSRWEETEWLGTECPRAPEFDGHTSADVLARVQRMYGR